LLLRMPERSCSNLWHCLKRFSLLAMPDDLPLFLATAGLFFLYLCWSAATEMGTKPFRWPGKK